MSFGEFCNAVNQLCEASGVRAVFTRRDGKHIARTTDGMTITGNSVSRKLYVSMRNHGFFPLEV